MIQRRKNLTPTEHAQQSQNGRRYHDRKRVELPELGQREEGDSSHNAPQDPGAKQKVSNRKSARSATEPAHAQQNQEPYEGYQCRHPEEHHPGRVTGSSNSHDDSLKTFPGLLRVGV